jgi:hypothetical protein
MKEQNAKLAVNPELKLLERELSELYRAGKLNEVTYK